MSYNTNPKTRQDVSIIYPAGYGACEGIATMPNPVIPPGTNAGFINESLFYEIGIMRPLLEDQWDHALTEYSHRRFNICQETIMTELNRARDN